MKTKTNQKLQTTKEVLKILGAAGLIAGVLIFPGLAQVLALFEDDYAPRRYRKREAFQKLQKNQAIKVAQTGAGIKIILTDKGKRLMLRHQINDYHKTKPAKWDGRWWLVMFDIPQARKHIRDLIRWKLKRIGFVTIQKSVAVYPYPCQDLIINLRSFHQLRPGELYVFEAKVLEGIDILKKHFKL